MRVQASGNQKLGLLEPQPEWSCGMMLARVKGEEQS
jgi:hypothetical protein